MASPLFLPLKVLLITIDLMITLVTFGWVKPLLALFQKTPLRSVPVEDKPYHRAKTGFENNLMTKPDSGATTLYEIAKYSFDNFASNICMNSREYKGMKSVKPPVKEFSEEITSLTYEEVGNKVMKFGAALRQEGLVPAPEEATLDPMSTPCSLAIFENTSAEWMISAMGAFSQSIVVTTIYATLGMDAVISAVQDGVISAIVCNKKDVSKLLAKASEMKTLKTIIYTNDCVAATDEINFGTVPKGIKVCSFDDFIEHGDVVAFPPTPPKPDTMAVLMYTSGSTGKPKGVVIKHSQVVACAASAKLSLGIVPDDVYLGYLPLAHILELMAEIACISLGVTICYADPKTLTSKGSYPKGALEQYSPTIMAGVPKIWDIIKKGVEAKISKSSPVAKFLIQTAFQWRMFAISNGFDTPLFKALVFKKFSVALGGKLRMGLSGGGPLNSEVQVFIRTCFGIPFVQGYGLTETNAGLTLQDTSDLRPGIAGAPISSVEVMLESVPEINDKAGLPYLNTDTRDVDGNKIYGRGEILTRGPSISLGYYMMKEKTKEVYRDDGFFHTGDIGQFMEDGSVRIVDRVKNLVKLKGGEYIAIENMEMTYGNCKFVDAIAGGICCYGDGDMDRPIALLQLSEPAAMEWAKENNVPGDFETVKASKELYDAVLNDMKIEHKKGGLSHLEKIIALCFLTDPWTPENGCLTAANKLQRRAVIEKFSEEFEATKAKGIF
mmetsp:Transcript_15375/g.19503  ORF Transcript_15375/g.19503 Transcript_15375/m.19503 type:complete len:723 (+) Transcript_15375:286-2454(+)|eukprot:CAMPEP_0203652510 /NCGR_PEP_ID=MMETSP0088-20131115/30160_1 /ASSEMBLY_ACC=CAM_ASM_001087 /TAXON_ID=426623 /ORGANISM="Chaetoceros affinis, Strain CCMP159" /LENGTH=722 /DNA_ID=CAMNT_0050512067 /DNA_START=206 /DNA_END=2374 /DNA_ORIENTATION=+